MNKQDRIEFEKIFLRLDALMSQLTMMNDRLKFIQTSLDIHEQRLTEIEDHLHGGEVVIHRDFEWDD